MHCKASASSEQQEANNLANKSVYRVSVSSREGALPYPHTVCLVERMELFYDFIAQQLTVNLSPWVVIWLLAQLFSQWGRRD